MSKYYYTISETFNKYKIKITQTYNEIYNGGHYIVVIEDDKGNIISSTRTVCGAPDGKINKKTLDEYIKSFKRDMTHMEKELL